MKASELSYRHWRVLGMLEEGRSHAQIGRTFNVPAKRIEEIEETCRDAPADVKPSEWPAILRAAKGEPS